MEPSKNVVMRGVPTMYRKEEFVLDMVPRRRERLAVMKDVPNMHRRKEYVLDMVQRLRLVAMRNVPTSLSREELRSNHARIGEVCMQHGAKKKICSHEGCTNYVKKSGL